MIKCCITIFVHAVSSQSLDMLSREPVAYLSIVGVEEEMTGHCHVSQCHEQPLIAMDVNIPVIIQDEDRMSVAVTLTNKLCILRIMYIDAGVGKGYYNV